MAMNQFQNFLYAHSSRVLESKTPKRSIVFSSEVTGSTFLNRSVCINRFDGCFQHSEVQIENYSSSFFYDLEQDRFWEFLYSDRWQNNVLLRVSAGELFSAIDGSLNELLQANLISRHVTVSYLKVKSKEEKEQLKFDLSPETVQVEFCYYKPLNPNERHPLSTTPCSFVMENPSLTTLSKSEKGSPDDPSSQPQPSEESPEKEEESKNEVTRITPASSALIKKLIDINLAFYPCHKTDNLEQEATSECSSLENEIQKGNWGRREIVDNKMPLERLGSRTTFKSILHDSVQKRLSKKISKKIYTDDSQDSDLKEKMLLKPISIDINLKALGKIMEREKFLKFKKMSSKERKKFFLSDERLMNMGQKRPSLTGQSWDAPISTTKTHHKKETEDTEIDNLFEFATLVLGITESLSIFHALLMIKKKEHEEKLAEEKAKLEAKRSRSRHALFADEFKIETPSSEGLAKEEMFKLRNQRSFIKTFTFHPKVFSPDEGAAPVFETERLYRSYSPERYQKIYHWEKEGDSKFQMMARTKIIIPNFSIKKLDIDPDQLIRALRDFIVRKERVVSSKGVHFVSLVFIRPIYLKHLFF